tara:strand:+ start:922 stop:1281 length:360 start_codon:yes stop_codon:yes gene_type:complete
MIKIGLENIKCIAPVGVLADERRNGNIFMINVVVWFKTDSQFEEDLLSETYDYSTIYNIVKEEMIPRTKLIEKVAFKMLRAIEKTDKRIKKVKIKIQKMNPPLKGDIQYSFVEIKEKVN